MQKYKIHFISGKIFSENRDFFSEQLPTNAKRRHYILCVIPSLIIYNVCDYEITYTGVCS